VGAYKTVGRGGLVDGGQKNRGRNRLRALEIVGAEPAAEVVSGVRVHNCGW
jgi:hypothetical protein